MSDSREEMITKLIALEAQLLNNAVKRFQEAPDSLEHDSTKTMLEREIRKRSTNLANLRQLEQVQVVA